jgi:hypothetical protein
MKVAQTFVPLSEMALKQRCEFLQMELDRTIERESRRACEAASLHELFLDTIDQVRVLASQSHVHPRVSKNMRNIADKYMKHLREIEDGKEFVRREDD